MDEGILLSGSSEDLFSFLLQLGQKIEVADVIMKSLPFKLHASSSLAPHHPVKQGGQAVHQKNTIPWRN